MSAHLIVGSQWGDEGKAKVIDYLSEKVDIIVRYQGGANAGHTVKVGDQTWIFHLIPSGILYPDAVCVIGSGVVLDPDAFRDELNALQKRGVDSHGRILLSDAAHLVLPFHRQIDGRREELAGKNKIGTTKRGIGMAYADKMLRSGLRLGETLDSTTLRSRLEQILELKNRELRDFYALPELEIEPLFDNLSAFAAEVAPMVVHTSLYLNDALTAGKNVLLEGAQGTGLDIDHGTYPYVTSSSTTTGGALSGSGISFQHLKRVTGICKAYVTRVGEGPFPTELHGDEGEKLRRLGQEFGATTGRPRRCGWFDTALLRHAARVNGLTDLAITKLDILSDYDTIPVAIGYRLDGKELPCFPSHSLERVEPIYEELPGWKCDISSARSYSDLPANCQSYLKRLQELTGVAISMVSVGPKRDESILL